MLIVDNKQEYILKIAAVGYNNLERYWDEQVHIVSLFVARLEAAGLIKFKSLD